MSFVFAGFDALPAVHLSIILAVGQLNAKILFFK